MQKVDTEVVEKEAIEGRGRGSKNDGGYRGRGLFDYSRGGF
jgi:hypothetical protein